MVKGNILLTIVAIALVMVGLNAGNVQDKLFGSNEEIYFDFNQVDLLNTTGVEVITYNDKVYNSLKFDSGFNNKSLLFSGNFGNLTAKELEEYTIEMKGTMVKGDNASFKVNIDFDTQHNPANLTNYNSGQSVNYGFEALQPLSNIYSTRFAVNSNSNSQTNLYSWVRERQPKTLGEVSGILNIKFNNVAKFNIFKSEVDLLNTTEVDKTSNGFEYYADEYFDTSDSNKVLDNAQFILSIKEYNSMYPVHFGANESFVIEYIKLIKG